MSYEAPRQQLNVNRLLPYPNERIPEHVLKKAEKELRETPEIKRISLKDLKNILQENPKLQTINFEEDVLVHYLRSTKYSTEKAFNKLQNYVDLREKHTYLFQGIPDEYFSTIPSLRAVSILPERCRDGCIVFYVHLRKYNPNEISVKDVKSYYLMLYMQLLRDPLTQINGFKFIYDMDGTKIQHFQLLNLQNLYLMYHVPLNCCPSRIKGIHLINPNIGLHTVWRIISPFIPEKIGKRCHFHSETRKLLDFFPASMLPAKYGGDLIDVNSSELTRMLNREHQNYPIQGQPNFY